MALSQDEAARVVGFNSTALDHLNSQLGQLVESVSVTATALSLGVFSSELTVAGAMTATLAAPANINDRKHIACVAASASPSLVLTITSPDTTTGYALPATVIFSAVGQTLELRATAGLKWRAVGGATRRSGIQSLVLGTTLTAGMVLAHTYACSVTNTVDSTGATKALPDGLFPGDRCFVTCPTVSGSPVGSLDFTGVTIANAAVTHMQAIGATTDTATLEWNGAAWLAVIATGITLA